MDVSRKVCGTNCTPEVIAKMAPAPRDAGVRAVKIADIEFRPKKSAPFYGAVITPGQDEVERFVVDGQFVSEHKPDVGRFIVALPDGSLSCMDEMEFMKRYG